MFHLLGTCLVKLDRKAEAVEVLTRGYKVADERGDKMPRDDMAKLLRELGAPVPEAAKPAAAADDGPGTGFKCHRPNCAAGNRAKQLAAAPLPDEIGQRIHREICAACWDDWFRNYSVKVINELRIDLSTAFGQEEYDKHMAGFFGFDEAS